MPEHVHEWRWYSEHGEDGIDCRLCDEEHGYRPENWMDKDDVIRRLNATERLSVLQAKEIIVFGMGSTRISQPELVDALRAYADTLEGQ